MSKSPAKWKRILKWSGSFIGLCSLALAIFLVPTLWGKPWKLDHLGTRALLQLVLDSPEILTQGHMLEQYGLDWYSDELDDRSIESRKQYLSMLDEYDEVFQQYDRAELSPSEQTSYDVMSWTIEELKRSREFLYYDLPVNQMRGVQSSLPEFMIHTHQILRARDAESYLARLDQFDRAFAQIVEGLKYRETLGVVPPKFVVAHVLKECREFIAPEPAKHVLYTHFEQAIEGLLDAGELDQSELETLKKNAEQSIQNHVYPAYQDLIDYLENFEPRAPTDDGVWRYPKGKEFYAHRLRFWTTTTLSPNEIHELGRREVESIQKEMKTILAAEGYEVDDLAATLRQLREDPKFLYPDTGEGREQILQDYTKILREIENGLDGIFDRRPTAEVVVKRVPEFKEKTAPAAYYQPPALDGSKPGTFFANLRDVSAVLKFGMRTLTFHEAVPGHHFQIALSLENPDLPLYRRIMPFSAFAEGWALYAESLAAEKGFQNDPFDRLGYLDAQLFRAVRLVVDTGIHHFRWSRERALNYMTSHLAQAESDLVAEVERYIVLPGQACSYKIGQLKILELRRRAQEKLGTRFSLPKFHNVLLLNGLLPLDVLEGVVDRWIEQQMPSQNSN